LQRSSEITAPILDKNEATITSNTAMTRRIYIETSVVSYLTARQSNDLIRSACQQITRSWWDNGRLASVSYISPYVVEEASAGDPQAGYQKG